MAKKVNVYGIWPAAISRRDPVKAGGHDSPVSMGSKCMVGRLPNQHQQRAIVDEKLIKELSPNGKDDCISSYPRTNRMVRRASAAMSTQPYPHYPEAEILKS
jgi:hypothetical protein